MLNIISSTVRIGATRLESTTRILGRTASTQSEARPATVCPPDEYKGSSNYVPGKQGYAPGFPPPKKWRDAVKPKPAPKLPTDLPAPSPKQNKVPTNTKSANDALRQYRQKLRQKRYSYMHENLVTEQRKRETRQESREKAHKLVEERRQKLIKERNEYIEKLRADPMSTENVLNAEGRTLMPNLPEEAQNGDGKKPRLHTLEPGYKLQPPRVSVSIPREANELRNKERVKNRNLTREQQHETRMQALMTLYHESASFVHYGNLNKMVHQCVDVLAISQPSLTEMTDNLNDNGGVITGAESARRTIEMRNMLQGTAGRQSKVGYEGLLRWKKENGGSEEQA
ncbi:hypothetical protein IW140_004304 [Coemansia sp. RSA 1813]|nr:hypothetical protein EV178_004377 [Coemansia sp. RSA 1646]KAJ1767394.1 hypothetical protein LPJ74_005386 [Coemansia sp. RSA 1843]KAJ2087956.1 hypothetical protein IW138_004553 [Coemansia sp. RSA 986]KAJ2211276.1 hypothetical protein EV179_005640 [Coemansia sp. RSA 487]KAJ2567794.1 hypothetical protein IW140_004304 [Coemansia sp. RSA 1813]